MPDFKANHWSLLDLQYEYLDDGFKLVATTDVPCHLYCRMTTTPPRKHALPSYRRGLYLQGDIRFCFVVYEDNEQDESGDTLTHTWNKSAWPICETRWFYFVGTQGGTPSVSETAIFKFHFPAPPPEPPPPIKRLFLALPNNANLYGNWGTWGGAWAGIIVGFPWWSTTAPYYYSLGYYETVSWFIFRTFFTFDTTILPETAKIQSANLHLYAKYQQGTPPFNPNICITLGVQSDPVVTTDWQAQLPITTIGGQKHINTFNIGAYNAIPFNAYGLTLIKTDQPTKLCIRQEADIKQVYPGVGAWAYLEHYSLQTGAGFRPYLEINYYPA